VRLKYDNGAVCFANQNALYILTSNPQIIRGGMKNWKVASFGHASKGRNNSKINDGLRGSLSRERITVSLQYFQASNQNSIFLSLLNSNA
jgi:hypothetical protein